MTLGSEGSSEQSLPHGEYSYVGTELENAAFAKNWKAYFGAHIRQYVRGHVLEVGAGLGATTLALRDGRQSSWTCLEPDAQLANSLRARLREQPSPVPTEVIVATLVDLESDSRFDCILYIDVLEHIEDDVRELRNATQHLAPGGSLVVLCPALPVLFSELDQALGHYRRYTKRSLQAVFPRTLSLSVSFYLDSLGAFASLANKFFLHQSAPTKAQVRAWDSRIIPVSRIVDSLIRRTIGRSIVVVGTAESMTTHG